MVSQQRVLSAYMNHTRLCVASRSFVVSMQRCAAYFTLPSTKQMMRLWQTAMLLATASVHAAIAKANFLEGLTCRFG